MPEVWLMEGESIDSALKRFKKECEKDGILTEVKRREFYEKPSEKRKRKALQARKKLLKKLKKQQQREQL